MELKDFFLYNSFHFYCVLKQILRKKLNCHFCAKCSRKPPNASGFKAKMEIQNQKNDSDYFPLWTLPGIPLTFCFKNQYI